MCCITCRTAWFLCALLKLNKSDCEHFLNLHRRKHRENALKLNRAYSGCTARRIFVDIGSVLLATELHRFSSAVLIFHDSFWPAKEQWEVEMIWSSTETSNHRSNQFYRGNSGQLKFFVDTNQQQTYFVQFLSISVVLLLDNFVSFLKEEEEKNRSSTSQDVLW